MGTRNALDHDRLRPQRAFRSAPTCHHYHFLDSPISRIPSRCRMDLRYAYAQVQPLRKVLHFEQRAFQHEGAYHNRGHGQCQCCRYDICPAKERNFCCRSSCLPGGVAYATDTLTAQRGFYGQNLGWGFNILLCITTQMMGYGLAGLFRKVLVWPGILNTATLHISCPDKRQLL